MATPVWAAISAARPEKTTGPQIRPGLGTGLPGQLVEGDPGPPETMLPARKWKPLGPLTSTTPEPLLGGRRGDNDGAAVEGLLEAVHDASSVALGRTGVE